MLLILARGYSFSLKMLVLLITLNIIITNLKVFLMHMSWLQIGAMALVMWLVWRLFLSHIWALVLGVLKLALTFMKELFALAIKLVQYFNKPKINKPVRNNTPTVFVPGEVIHMN
jgi:hypothetical protein